MGPAMHKPCSPPCTSTVHADGAEDASERSSVWDAVGPQGIRIADLLDDGDADDDDHDVVRRLREALLRADVGTPEGRGGLEEAATRDHARRRRRAREPSLALLAGRQGSRRTSRAEFSRGRLASAWQESSNYRGDPSKMTEKIAARS